MPRIHEDRLGRTRARTDVDVPPRSGDGLHVEALAGQRRYLGLSLYQAGALVFAIVLLLVAGDIGSPDSPALLPVLSVVVLSWCVVQLTANIIAYRGGRREAYRGLRLSIDLAFCLSLVWLTGGVLSLFSPLLVAIVLATSTALGRQRALAVASSTTVILVGLTASQVLGWIPVDWSGGSLATGGVRSQFLFSALIAQGAALHAVAFLGARLMGGIRRVERLNDQIVAGIGDGIIALDEKGRVLLLNEPARDLLGHHASANRVGEAASTILRREGDSRLRELLLAPEEGTWRIELYSRSGEARPLSVQIRRLPSPMGRGCMWVFLVHDLTLEEQAARASERIQHLEAIEDLALGLVHEIRNPLASIRGCAQEIGGGKIQGEQVEQLCRIVCRESDRLDRIVDEFFESSSASPTQWDRFDLVALIRDVCEGLRQRTDTKAISISVEGEVDATVEGQRELLYRAFLNLGVNAVEACVDRGIVRFRVEREGEDQWRIEVEDTGCGMDAATRKRIFNPFFTSKAREGGLGLSLVERILTGHGGSISVESNLGQGARFGVLLPIPESGRTEQKKPAGEVSMGRGSQQEDHAVVALGVNS